MLKDASDLKLIRRAALHTLSRRDYSKHELSQKLLTKGFEDSLIQQVIAELIQSGYINEHRFTENFIHWRRNRGYGPLRISKELTDRGIPHEVIAEHLEIHDNEWFVHARKIWHKQFKGQIPQEYNQKAKQMRFLQYRGFTKEQIMTVFTN